MTERLPQTPNPRDSKTRRKPRPTKACEACGAVYERPPRISNRQWEARRVCSHACANAFCSNSKGRFDVELFRQLIAEGLTGMEIAERMGFSRQAISARLRRMGIPRPRGANSHRKVRRSFEFNRISQPPKQRGHIETVAEYLASGGRITLCPTKYVAPCQNAIEGAEAARRLASMAAVDHKADSWKGRKSA